MTRGPRRSRRRRTSRPTSPPGRYVFLEVSDTGRGMSRRDAVPHLRSVLLDQVHRPRPGPRGVLGIVRSHQRRAAGREPRRGAAAVPPAAAALGDADAPRPVGDAGLARLARTGVALVIDDEPSVRHVAQRMLTAMGFEVVTVSTGQEGLALFSDRPRHVRPGAPRPTMPGMSGDEIYRHLRTVRRCRSSS